MVKSIIKNDDHHEDIKLLFDRLNIIPKKGVLHLGAHKGEEVDYYLNVGFKKIILIEANPSLCYQMKRMFEFKKNILVYNYAVCDQVGSTDFFIHESRTGVESSSILKMDKFDKIVSSLKTSKKIIVPCCTIDSLVMDNHIDLSLYNVLVSDIQGADYLALKGAKNSICSFDAVIIEVQCVNLYENFISETMIDQLMEDYGFYKDFVIYHELYRGETYFPAWGEAIYINKRFSKLTI